MRTASRLLPRFAAGALVLLVIYLAATNVIAGNRHAAELDRTNDRLAELEGETGQLRGVAQRLADQLTTAGITPVATIPPYGIYSPTPPTTTTSSPRRTTTTSRPPSRPTPPTTSPPPRPTTTTTTTAPPAVCVLRIACLSGGR